MEQFVQHLEETRQALLQMQNVQTADQARIAELQNARGAAQGELHHLRGAAAAAAAAGPGPRAGAAERFEPSLVYAKGFTKVPSFIGNANQWSTFEFKFFNFAESVIPNIRTLIDWATDQPEQITELTSREAIRLNPAAEAIQRHIYSARTIRRRRSARDPPGLYSSGVQGARGVATIDTPVRPPQRWQAENHIFQSPSPEQVRDQRFVQKSGTLDSGRATIRRAFRETPRRPYHSISIVIGMTPEPLRQHFILNQSRLNGYVLGDHVRGRSIPRTPVRERSERPRSVYEVRSRSYGHRYSGEREQWRERQGQRRERWQ